MKFPRKKGENKPTNKKINKLIFLFKNLKHRQKYLNK